jgi:hypothetical protein
MEFRKVYGGTPLGGDSKCDTCAHGRLIKGYAESERIVLCDRYWDPIRITFKVAECSEYLDRRLPRFDDLEEIALDITVERGRKVSGFATAGAKEKTAQQSETEEADKEEQEEAEPACSG